MRKKALFFPVLAALILAGCSNDDVSEVIQDETPKVFTGDEAYISVRLADAGSIYSRATTGNPDYEYGSSNEHAVKNAYFYFYDANGVFVSEGNAWNDGDSSVPEEGNAAGNIEFRSNTVVVLKGLTRKNYPQYMVTVLNRPSDFVPGGTLAEMETKLVSNSAVGITTQYDGTNHFVMSTTSWAEQNTNGVQTAYVEGKQLYFVTEVKEGNFSLEPIDDNKNKTNYVTVYVERLAAKVTLKMGNLSNNVVILNDGTKLYEIQATVAGDKNEATEDDNIAAEKLYVKIDGWKLNATAKKSNIVKNIDETWTKEKLGFVWNNTTDHRSFWGKSFNYEKSSYPENAAGANNSEYLNYVNLQDDKTNSPLLGLAESDYCAENTNTEAIVTANFPSCVTSILVKATVCNSNGEALPLVRFNGELFKETDYVKYILNVMKTKNQWNVWVSEGTQDKKYVQLDESYLKVESVGDGKVKVMLDDTKISATLILYQQSALPDENGKYTYDQVKTEDKETFIGKINEALLAECNSNATSIGYENGNMYYNIPIEHLNESNKVDGKYDGIKEANYGVVRNHHYVVTINKLEKIGKGIFNPEEVIVPGKDDDKDAYYVGANINILSWKIVKQSVEL